ncbi:MAG: hypothetical protein Q9162_007605, partial [Coniocarpon cinnabarinum]
PPDDGWEPVWEQGAHAYYFYNRFTGATQWKNPRVPDGAVQSSTSPPSGVGQPQVQQQQEEDELTIKPAAEGGYNPAIHGSFDPEADYAQPQHTASPPPTELNDPSAIPQHDPTVEDANTDDYTTTATFNKSTGHFQNAEQNPARHSDDAKANRQMNAFFDVDAAANAHNGRSLRAERQQRRLTKEELRGFRERKKERREKRRREWLRD